MFEFEVSATTALKPDKLKEATIAFTQNTLLRDSAEAISPLLWEEHCTECAMPECYLTCDLYIPRNDSKCRRFVNGFAKICDEKTPLKTIVHIEFKQWANLLTTGTDKVADIKDIDTLNKKISKIEALARSIPDDNFRFFGRTGFSSRIARKIKKHLVNNLLQKKQLFQPSFFVIEAYNPHDFETDFTLSIRSKNQIKGKTPFQKRVMFSKGFNFIKISYLDIIPFINESDDSSISLVPNISTPSTYIPSLFLRYIGFVKFSLNNNNSSLNSYSDTDKKVKVVIWDLDNTLWDGILVEQIENDTTPKLKEGIESIIKTLDKRGIVNSISSKNDFESTRQKLESLKIFDYFVFPEINWEPKSISVHRIINNFNIAPDTVVFIDDSAFEREEVLSQHPEVRVIDSIYYNQLLSQPAFSPEISTESHLRREFYKNQGKRKKNKNNFDGDYLSFLRESKIIINIEFADSDNLDRIHELVQRTNQMNFSGTRYNKQEIKRLVESPKFDTYKLECEDIYGSYGTVGFCVIDKTIPKVTDVAFSCRIQSKRVEHAFFTWIIQKYKSFTDQQYIYFTFNQNDRNKPVGKVFKDLNFQKDGDNQYKFSLTKNLVNENIILINDRT